jgi:hypothetical protein
MLPVLARETENGMGWVWPTMKESSSKTNDNEGSVVQVFDSLPFSTLLNKTHWREEAMMVAPLAGTAWEQINNADQKAELWNANIQSRKVYTILPATGLELASKASKRTNSRPTT